MPILTAGDVVRRCITFGGGDQNGDKNMAQARLALADAVRTFPVLHRWNFYKAVGRVNLIRPYNAGTVTFDPVANTLTLAGGTWPAWAVGGRVRVGLVTALVAARTSGTVVALDSILTFPAAFAAKGYRLFLDAYDLPPDFNAMQSTFGADCWGGLRYSSTTSYLWGSEVDDAVGPPVYFTVFPKRTGGFRLGIRPYSDQDRTLDFLYYRTMRPVKYDVGLNLGTVNVSGTACVCTKPMFVPDMAGSVIRITNTASPPELKGIVVHETTIAAVTTPTDLTLTDPFPVTATGLGYTVSDPIDVEPNTGATAFMWLAIRTAASEAMSKGSSTANGQYQEALENAKLADSRYAGPDTFGPRSGGTVPYWKRGTVVDG